MNLRRTQRVEIPPELLDAVFPEHRRRPEPEDPCPAERIAAAVDDARDVERIRAELSKTRRDLPVVSGK